MPQGRPSVYSAELAQSICARLAAGESLRAICKPDDMPAESTVRLWAVENREGFSAQYARARDAQADALAEQILEIADDGTNDTFINADGDEIVNHDHINRSRLRVDARKWFASKVAPKRYGDKVQNEHVGEGGGPITFSWASSASEAIKDPSAAS